MVVGGLALAVLGIALLLIDPSFGNAGPLLVGVVTVLSGAPATYLSERPTAARGVRIAGYVLCVPLVAVVVLSFLKG
jgi:hypothetical protein